MKKHAVLFDWPISEINRLADSDVAERFSETLDDNAQASFATLTDHMRNIGADLASAKARRIHFSNWSLLRQCLKQFTQEFCTFPDAKLKKFMLHVLLAEKLTAISIDIPDEEVNENLFEIRHLINSVPQSWFVRQNNNYFENSVAVFSCDDSTILENAISQSNISPQLIYQLLTALYVIQEISPGHWALVNKAAPQVNDAAVEAFVHLLILSTGESLHKPKIYSQPPNILNADQIKAGEGHQQWRDIHNVLSEYNSRNEILLKYLTIYHVVENLMLKSPIVELERQQAGKMFSIRDFRRLYKEVDGKEMDLLKRLFSAVFKMPAKTGVMFGAHLHTKWKNFASGARANNADQALILLGIKKKSTDFNAQAGGIDLFTNIVYQVRCAIVHNKETEFHLTYASLDNNISALIESFLIPSLEEICFSLIGSQNSEVWYSKKEIMLYQ